MAEGHSGRLRRGAGGRGGDVVVGMDGQGFKQRRPHKMNMLYLPSKQLRRLGYFRYEVNDKKYWSPQKARKAAFMERGALVVRAWHIWQGWEVIHCKVKVKF
jgi:hypothetical protein